MADLGTADEVDDSSLDDLLAEADGGTADADHATLMAKARQGTLTTGERASLEGLSTSDEGFTSGTLILYQDSKARKDIASRRRYLDKLLTEPSNGYNPVFLSERAQVAILEADYDEALDRASKAEQHWQRLPSSQVFNRKAQIYAAKAKAWQGKFYQTEDLDALRHAISSWQKYQEHVKRKSRTDLAKQADAQIAKLNDIKRRLE